ncbi:ABC transporter permease [Candidatus Parvarchaeota archaeon]|nr:ABC transporter permease [Candidatus Parvarchaeota archaeon]
MASKASDIKARRMNPLGDIFVSFKYQFKSFFGTIISLSILVSILFLLIIGAYAVLFGHASLNIQSITSAIESLFGNANALFSSSFQIIWYITVLVAALVGGAILLEIGSKYSYFLFAQPSSRYSIVIGRYLAAFVGSAIIMAVYYITAILVSLYLFHSTASIISLLISFSETLLIILAVLSLIVFIGSPSDNPQAASMATLFLLLFGFYLLMGFLPMFYPTTEPWFMLNYAAESAYTVFSSTFQHVTVSNQSVQHPPISPKVSGLNGFSVSGVTPSKSVTVGSTTGGNEQLMMFLGENFPGGVILEWVNFTFPNHTNASYSFYNEVINPSLSIGVPFEYNISPGATYPIGVNISYRQPGMSQSFSAYGTVYVNSSDLASPYTYIIRDTYQPYPLESAEIAAGYTIFFLSLGLLIYGRREIK